MLMVISRKGMCMVFTVKFFRFFCMFETVVNKILGRNKKIMVIMAAIYSQNVRKKGNVIKC